MAGEMANIVGRVFIERYFKTADKPIAELEFEDIFKLPETIYHGEVDMKAQMQQFLKVNQQLDLLPGYDCGACGYPSCRAMAKEIVAGNATIGECKILKSEVKE